jgi:hypothetical protein
MKIPPPSKVELSAWRREQRACRFEALGLGSMRAAKQLFKKTAT